MDTISVDLAFTRKDIRKASEQGRIIVVIDVLRASSTIITALSNGAEGIIPAETLREARIIWKRYPESLLAGERRGLKPRGFHLGNSPLEFKREIVEGKMVILTTTSGTKTIGVAKASPFVVLAAFINASAAAERILQIAQEEGLGITLAPSGQKNSFSLEDFLCAGAIAMKLEGAKVEFSDFALGALLSFQGLKQPLDRFIWNCHHARELCKKGFEADVKFCSRLDVFQRVPILKHDRDHLLIA
ncbi:MAG: 2-phosphosulfolactate phosphatase [Candidatus Bathyarchaeia archaeon]